MSHLRIKLKISRPSFTLVELLVVIAIIGVLASMVLVTLRSAQRDAMTIRTQGTIKKINGVILTKWEEFRYRSVRIDIPPQYLVPYQTPEGWQLAVSPREGARMRMIALRDLMRMEMPDRLSDILYPPIWYRMGAYTADNYRNPPNTTNDVCINDIPRDVSGAYLGLRRTFISEVGAPFPLSLNPYPPAAPVVPVGASLATNTTNQAAELLYEIVATSNLQGGSALEMFRPSELGDTDGDGYKEFIDAWGKPIYWLRWPAGYTSPLNDGLTPDPLDPLKTDWRWSGNGAKPWMLVPLIVSAGPDGAFDLIFELDPSGSGFTPTVDPSTGPIGSVRYATNTWNGATDPGGRNVQREIGAYYYPDPYLTLGPYQLGQVYDLDADGQDGSLDNITNYELVLQ